MKTELDLFRPTAEAMSLLLSPYAETVIHDFKTGRIYAIFNNLSKRRIGDESLLGDAEALSESQDVFPPYFKTNWDGKKMKTVSAVLRSRAGNPIGLLCINLDVSKWEQMHQFILEFLDAKLQQPEFLFKNDWKERMNAYVASYLKKHSLCLEMLSREQKQQLISELRKEGAFETKHAASYAAEILQISRATVYNYLKEAL